MQIHTYQSLNKNSSKLVQCSQTDQKEVKTVKQDKSKLFHKSNKEKRNLNPGMDLTCAFESIDIAAIKGYARGSSTVYNKWKKSDMVDTSKSPKCSDFNVSENLSPKSFLKSVYNRSDWSVLKNVQMQIPKIETNQYNV